MTTYSFRLTNSFGAHFYGIKGYDIALQICHSATGWQLYYYANDAAISAVWWLSIEANQKALHQWYVASGLDGAAFATRRELLDALESVVTALPLPTPPVAPVKLRREATGLYTYTHYQYRYTIRRMPQLPAGHHPKWIASYSKGDAKQLPKMVGSACMRLSDAAMLVAHHAAGTPTPLPTPAAA
jgi:hypothetical protein